MAVQKQSIKSRIGPADYAAGGFTLVFGEFQKVVAASVVSDKTLKVANTIYSIDKTISGNTVTILVLSASTVGGGPNAWAEVADHTDLHTLTFTAIAVGE